ncbi:threonine/serine exporter family protein [Dermabacteraceae bacterium TAE3-ERU27]|nr:threonine/serine exporter family protein [Dermabacteraceae bacterium TAE3-ERU27]
MPATRRLHAVFDFAMRTGELMLSNGSPAADVTATLLRIVSASGIRNVTTEVTFNEISLSYLPDEEALPFTRLRAVHNRTTDYSRLDALENNTHRYCAGEIDLPQARANVLQIEHAQREYSQLLTAAGWTLLGGGAAFSLGAGTLVVIAAMVASGVISFSLELLDRYRLPIFYLQAFGGFVGALSAIIVHVIDESVNSSIVVVACIMMLLAGLTSIGAFQDAITGWYVTASARVFETVMLTLGLVIGVQAGIMLADRVGSDISISAEVPVTLNSILVMTLAGAAIGFGFAVGCQVPARLLLACASLAAFGSLISSLMTAANFGALWSVGVASGAVGFASVMMARHLHTPAITFVMCAVVPMVPGSLIYRGLLAIGDDVQRGGIYLITAGGVAIALASGSVFGQYLATGITWRFRRAMAFTPVIAAPFATSRWRRRVAKPRLPKRPGPKTDTMTIEVTATKDAVQPPS